MRALAMAIVTTLASCAPAAPPSERSDNAPPPVVATGPLDDGSYLARIDPLGGQWRVDRIGDTPFPVGDPARGEFAYVSFSEGGFLNSYAGCGGGQPAFYRLDGDRISITRREPAQIGKCEGTGAAAREALLAGFLDRAARWARPSADRLELTAADGTVARLFQPSDPHPRLSGRWRVLSLDEKPLASNRPIEVGIGYGPFGGSISAVADCNQFSAHLAIIGSALKLGDGIQTAMGCGLEREALDSRLFGAVGRVNRYVLRDDGRLLLQGASDILLERFPPPDRRLAGDYEHCGNTVLGGYHEGPVTLAIDAATIRDNAGCAASYSVNGPELTLRLGDAPACRIASPPWIPGEAVGIGGAISPLAVLRPDGFGFTERGQLVLRTRRGLLAMCRKGEPKPFGSG